MSSDNSSVYSFVPIVCLIAGSNALNWWLRRVSFLSDESFEEPVIVLAMLQRLPESGWRNILPALIAGLMVVRFRSLGICWSRLPQGSALRLMIGAAAFVVTWMFSTSEYNCYFDRSFLIDRLLLFALFVATVYRPVFVIPFLMVVFPFIAQFNFLIGGYTLSIPSLPLHVLVLFAAMFLMGLMFRKWNSSSFVFVVLCVFAGHYWPSGLGKMRLGWLWEDHVYFLLPSTYANGWLGFLEHDTIGSLAHALSGFNLAMKVVTVVMECGAIVFLWKRSSLLGFLSAWIALHVGIFLLSGICFWPWVVMNFVLLRIIWLTPEVLESAKWTRSHFVLSVLLIVGCHQWLWSPKLSWLDAAATYTYRFEAVGESGNVYSLPPRFFAPYHYQFTLSSFSFLSTDPTINVSWGATLDRGLARRLANAGSTDEILQIEREFGTVSYNAVTTAGMEQFLRQFVWHRVRRGSGDSWLNYLRAPSELWTFSREDAFRDQEGIARLKVTRLFSCYVDGRYEELSETPVLDLEILNE